MASPCPVLIPTPQECRFLGVPGRRFQRGAVCRAILCGPRHPQTALAVRLLREALRDRGGVRLRVTECLGPAPADTAPWDVVLCGNGDAAVRALFPPGLPDPAGPAPEQGYLLHAAPGLPVKLYARHPLGLLYAVTTLAQLLEPAGEGLCVPGVVIRDFPAFRWRGSNWNLFGEIGGWSYERGDGQAAFERRILRKLDLCLQCKANLVIADGLGWNSERFPGYGALMRRLNRAARLRGVRLLYTGYGSGYGCPSHDGPVFRNREQYPDGPVYPCCGVPSAHAAASSIMGTCLSNRGLLRLKQANLAEFAARVEPGALYIHNLDASVLAEAAPLWAMRCPRCRERWPNDALAAPDGMAGAFGWFYEQLAEAVNAVRNPRTGYEARRDCLLMMVSPNYGDCSEDDAAWEACCEYYAEVGRHIRQPNVIIGLREQFGHRRPGGLRFARLREHLDRHGVRVPFGTIAFTGGDGYYNNIPFLGTPVLTSCFRGADLVLHAHGNGYQEPQQLLNAEFSWNPARSAFHREPLPASGQACRQRCAALSSGRARPAGLFGPEGFLEAACRRLYGPAAGPAIARIYRLRGRTSLRPLSERLDRVAVLLPVWGMLMPAGRFSIFRRLGVRWREDADAATRARGRLLGRALLEMAGLNRRAACWAARAAKVCAGEPETRGDLAWLACTLRAGTVCAQRTAAYLRVMERARASIERGSGPARARVAREIQALRRTLALDRSRLLRQTPAEPLDYLGGDVGFRRQVLDALLDELKRMEVTLETGRWLPVEPSTWW